MLKNLLYASLLVAVLAGPSVAVTCDCGAFCTPMPSQIRACGACKEVKKCDSKAKKPLTVPRPIRGGGGR